MQIVLVFLAMFSLRILWETYPGIFPCILFWGVVMLYIYTLYNTAKRMAWPTFPLTIMTAGFSMNAAVTISNGGFMPVSQVIENYSLWVMATNEHNLLFLADNYWGCSIGDFVILSGILLYFLTGVVSMLCGMTSK